jgi:predicted metal-dependent hydrolase
MANHYTPRPFDANSFLPNLQVRRSLKAKRLRLSVKPGMIVLTVPERVSQAQAMAFFERHRAWAEAKLAELDARAGAPSRFAANATLPWRGREIPLVIIDEPRRHVSVRVEDTVLIALPNRLAANREATAARALFAWTKTWLSAEIARLSARHAPREGLHPREIRVKRMKTRWGSCGSRNDLNFNWLLAFAPETVLEYLVVHELCHIRERNHSPAFWSLVARHMPDYAEQRQWLRAHGSALMRRLDDPMRP